MNRDHQRSLQTAERPPTTGRPGTIERTGWLGAAPIRHDHNFADAGGESDPVDPRRKRREASGEGVGLHPPGDVGDQPIRVERHLPRRTIDPMLRTIHRQGELAGAVDGDHRGHLDQARIRERPRTRQRNRDQPGLKVGEGLADEFYLEHAPRCQLTAQRADGGVLDPPEHAGLTGQADRRRMHERCGCVPVAVDPVASGDSELEGQRVVFPATQSGQDSCPACDLDIVGHPHRCRDLHRRSQPQAQRTRRDGVIQREGEHYAPPVKTRSRRDNRASRVFMAGAIPTSVPSLSTT